MSFCGTTDNVKETIKKLETNSQAHVPITNLQTPNGGVRTSSNKATPGVEAKLDKAAARKK